ncbi:MAG TPA: TadE/TadG family type IV pilus assembly protein, partial [Novosphingobium sp.]|nr:TadE/TadG family type IV pilus assembly protein [Novosphingobium sp.]
MVMQARRFPGNRAGLATVEFAFLAPVMLGFILLLIAGGRMEWTRQVLQEAADSGARCMAIGGSSCGTTATVQSYTAARAQSGGVLLSASAVTVTSNQTCNGVTGMNS